MHSLKGLLKNQSQEDFFIPTLIHMPQGEAQMEGRETLLEG